MVGGQIDWAIFAAVHLFGMFNALYIVYANDFADRETDEKNKTFNMKPFVSIPNLVTKLLY